MIRALAVCCLTLVLPGLAAAAERQHHLGLAPVGSLFKSKNHAVSPGIGAIAMYTYGLTDQFNLMAEASHSFFTYGGNTIPGEPFIRPGFITTGAVGVSYVLDVLTWVPYGGVMLSGNLLGGGTRGLVTVPANGDQPAQIRNGGGSTLSFAPDAQLVLGLDYQFTRHLVAGAGFRQHVMFTKLKDYPSWSQLFLKVEWQWGY